MVSYGKFRDFEIRDITYLGAPPNDGVVRFDLVKWEEDERCETADWKTNEKKISNRSCFSIARLCWNSKEPCFKLESVGLRYLEYREDGLEEWLIKWCALKEVEFRYEEDT